MNSDPRYVCLLAHDFARGPRVQIKGREALPKGARVLAVFAPGQLRLYLLDRESRSLVEQCGPAFRLAAQDVAARIVPRRTVFGDGRWEVFYTIASQRRVAEKMLQLADLSDPEQLATVILALERVIKSRAYGGELTDEEMTRGWETYQKILARAFGTDQEGERAIALRMALKRAMKLAGIGGAR